MDFPDLAKVDGGESGRLASKRFGQIPASMAYAARGVDWSAPHPAINKPTEREQLRDEPHYSVLRCFSLSLSCFLHPILHLSSSSPFLFLLLFRRSRLSRSLLFFLPNQHAINDSARARCITGAFEKRATTCSRIITSRRMLKASCTFSFHALISFFFSFFHLLFFHPFSSFSAASLFNLFKTLTRTSLVIPAS